MSDKLFVVGGGFMGSGIAQTAICAGIDVTMTDLSAEILERARGNIAKSLERRVTKGAMSRELADAALGRLHLSGGQEAAAQADFIIEAVAERAEVKQAVFAQLSAVARPDAILASNTSSISITKLAAAAQDPARFIGMHFFSPVPAMKLLELVRGLATSQETVARAKEFGRRLGKVCIVSKDTPAFIVNRLLDPMLNEAVMLLERGVGTVEDIDAGVKNGLNHPMGPFELLDMVGIDITLAVMEVLYGETADSKYRPSTLMRNMVRAKWLGRKTGIGFYQYNADGTKVPNPNL